MTERYWVSGAQLGMLLAHNDMMSKLRDGKQRATLAKSMDDLLMHIADEQFIGHISEGGQIVIREMISDTGQ